MRCKRCAVRARRRKQARGDVLLQIQSLGNAAWKLVKEENGDAYARAMHVADQIDEFLRLDMDSFPGLENGKRRVKEALEKVLYRIKGQLDLLGPIGSAAYELKRTIQNEVVPLT